MGEGQLEHHTSLVCLFLVLEKGQVRQGPLIGTPSTTLDGFLEAGNSLSIIHFSLDLSWRRRGEESWQKGERDKDQEDNQNSIFLKKKSIHMFIRDLFT